MTKPTPDRTAEQGFLGSVAGMDEVGRGPLCGPVVAAAVILPGPPLDLKPERFAMIRDSKAMSAKGREEADVLIRATCIVGFGQAEAEEIDRLGILRATFLAMRRAMEALPHVPDHLLVDGNQTPPGMPCSVATIVKGDATCLAIAAASVVAKVRRDAIMKDLHLAHPQYGWDRNSGYGTAEHRDAIRTHGPTSHHRRSFSWGLEIKPEQLDLFSV